MKKVLFIVLSLMLCLALCACGEMAGEKAAELYPDIIGQWGTDPFGEEFVLTLAKDGSCNILGTDGTWTLNEKESSEEWVTLTVKTENVKYHVQLDRAQHASSSNHLWIADAKQEATIYEDYVFAKGNHFVFADLALQAVPELVGDWGTPYWNEEPVIVIREDGTCSVLRQPGKWCLDVNQATWPEVLMRVKLDSGIQYEIRFGLDTDVDWGYLRARMNIHNLSDDAPVIIDPAREASHISGLVNRQQVIHPMEFASVAVGEWTEDEDKQSFATFREDGTCTIRGADGLWSLDYPAYYQEKFRNGWDYCLLARINSDEYDIRFSAPDDNGKCTMYIINQDDDIYILDATEVFKRNADS